MPLAESSTTAIFNRLEQQKAELLKTIETWSTARLLFRPAAGQWCAVEMLDHIVKVENGILAATRLGMKTPHRIGIRDRLGFLFLDRIFRSELKVKVPSSAPHVLPDASMSLESVVQGWDSVRKDLAQLLSHVAPDQLQAGVFRHPVSGWMSLPQVLRFFSVHIQHHNFQLVRLSAASAGH